MTRLNSAEIGTSRGAIGTNWHKKWHRTPADFAQFSHYRERHFNRYIDGIRSGQSDVVGLIPQKAAFPVAFRLDVGY
ncbi:hypothetical protein AAC691_10295 [Nguyenibacter vanlangensis]|uniref:Uncharacterized protein n=1 Tax=Nguyenibacter vanlangensis TaxID=1216886 RepID=A0ABZ3DAZ2_9PROT